ncbi:Sodium/hydrogen exchanger isoform 1 [Hibiscus syriacus]|uniref:Sodium/hydrogen exchanger isoform 1 n=1 Tax=Hibiscus syriacus TaxID=106335 RepID=A0A6A2Z288_HIBSY|nr:protein NETWORKED 3A-like [Hibiscus syriacus]KAE8685205.1 Sodium/hydrogen exchanger isoform 1 [Hibiscus syriacus]
MTELDNKKMAMLKLMEGDGDSFAQRAEMYYKNRPELINLVEDLYRSHRSLAERYDRVKCGYRSRLIITLGSQFSSMKYISNNTYDRCSDILDYEDYAESDVDDPDPKHEHNKDILTKGDAETEDGTLLDREITGAVPSEAGVDEATKLREEVERLKEENENLKAESLKKDEEKREVIRQLSFAIKVLKDENVELKKRLMKDSIRKWNPLGFIKLKDS